MTEEETKERTEWENNISRFFDATCPELDFMVLLYLRRRHPHQGTQQGDLERAIAMERRKNAG